MMIPELKKFIDKHGHLNTWQAIYDSEINTHISSFWDGGWDVRLGDKLNGYKAETAFYVEWSPQDEPHNREGFLKEAIEWLAEEVIKQYPISTFAKRVMATKETEK